MPIKSFSYKIFFYNTKLFLVETTIKRNAGEVGHACLDFEMFICIAK